MGVRDGSVSLSWLFLRSQVYYFCSCCDKTPDKVYLRRERVDFGSKFEDTFVVAGKTWRRQVLAAAGHMASAGRKESDHWCSAHSFFFFNFI